MRDGPQIKFALLEGMKIHYVDFVGREESDKTVYIQSLLHGNETRAVSVLFELIKQLATSPPPFSVRVVPIANPIGMLSELSGVNGRISKNGEDWNRIFKEDFLFEPELENYSSALAKVIWELSDGFDFIIDVHTPDYGHAHVYSTNMSFIPNCLSLFPVVLGSVTTSGAFEDANIRVRENAAITLELPSILPPTHGENLTLAKLLRKCIAQYQNAEAWDADTDHFLIGSLQDLISPAEGFISCSSLAFERNEPNEFRVEVISSDGNSHSIFHPEICMPLCFRRNGLALEGEWAARVFVPKTARGS